MLTFHLTQFRISNNNKLRANSTEDGVGGWKGYTLLVGMRINTTTMETGVQAPENTKNRTSIGCKCIISGYSWNKESQPTIDTA